MSDNPATETLGHPAAAPYANQRLRDIAVACLGGGFVLGAVAVGVFASKDGSTLLAIGLGVPSVALLALFGIAWDSQHPRTSPLVERIRPGMRHLVWQALIVGYVGWTLSRH